METWNVEQGRVPLLGWGCTDSDKIDNGSLDDVIRRTAQVMRDFGHESTNHDVLLDLIVTPERVIDCRPGRRRGAGRATRRGRGQR